MRAFRVAYDGTGYRGFQRQPHGETVEDALLDALARLDAYDAADADTPPGYAAAGRTDAGVSAVAQTVAFEAPDWLAPRAFDAELPADVRAYASADAPDGFHATHDAVRRRYEYHLHAPEADDAAAREALGRLAGTHDFHNLTPDDGGTERELSTDLDREGSFLRLGFAAGGFPRAFVRRAVALVAAVAAGDRDPAFVDRVLAAEPLAGPDGIGAAAPEPLVLVAVEYDPALDLAFRLDDEAAASAWTAFERARVERETGARVAAQLRTGASRDP
ncbi:MAG: tRNA pseudouridine(38-40) synthase TruA [Haloarculaceae archaeon]